jgi:hypothetical protein
VNYLAIENGKVDFHPNRLRFMFALTVFFAGVQGVAYLTVPNLVASLFGAPVAEVVWAAGYAYSYLVAQAIIAVLGLRSPLKFSPVLLVQATTKIVWIFAVAVPGLVAGTLSSFALALCVINALWVIGDILVMPFRYFLAK